MLFSCISDKQEIGINNWLTTICVPLSLSRFYSVKSPLNRIFFTADLHFGHRNILRYQTDRPFTDHDDTAARDAWLLDLWRSTVDKKDMVYLLGDLTFFKSEDVRHLQEKLPGRKYLISGNHDGARSKSIRTISRPRHRYSTWRFVQVCVPGWQTTWCWICAIIRYWPGTASLTAHAAWPSIATASWTSTTVSRPTWGSTWE